MNKPKNPAVLLFKGIPRLKNIGFGALLEDQSVAGNLRNSKAGIQRNSQARRVVH
jgi:hypothetical protein